MQRLEIGQKVGVFYFNEVRFGTVLDIEDKVLMVGGEQVKKSIHYFVSRGESELGSWWHEIEVFPAWEGNYTAECAGEFVYQLIKNNMGNLAERISILDAAKSGAYIFDVVRRVQNVLDTIDSDGLYEAKKFLDWAAHGFPAGEVRT